jgi:protein phosphatase
MHIEAAVTRSEAARQADHGTDAVWVEASSGLGLLADGATGPAGSAALALQRVVADRDDLGAQRAAADDGSSGARLRIGRTLELAFLGAHDQLLDEQPGSEVSLGAVVVAGQHATIAHVGNVRAYLLRDGRIRRLTGDHSVAMQRVRAGRLTAPEAARSDLRHRLTQALGGSTEVDVDLAAVALADGDRLLLCSDGLHDGLGEDAMARALARPELDAAADRLMSLAHDAHDRSLVLLEVRSDADQEVLAEIATVMADTFLFRDLSERERALVAPYLEHRFLEPGEVLFEEGDPGDTFFVVVDGTLRIRRGDVHLVDVSTGGHFGELCLARRADRSATVEALDEALVFGLRRERFQQIVARRPSIGARIALAALDQLGHRVRDLTERLAEGS